MQKATLYVRSGDFLTNNGIFNAAAFGSRMKSDGYPFVALKKELAKLDIDIATQDIHPVADSKYVFCLDYPDHFLNIIKSEGQLFALIISEPEIYTPASWNPEYHKLFDKVFTYNNQFGFNDKYRRYFFSIDLEFYRSLNDVKPTPFGERKLCSLVANAVLAMPPIHTDSLLYERYKVLQWFGKNKPTDFDFYSSVGKEKDYYFMMRGGSILKRVLPAFLFKKFVAYRQKNIINVYRGFFPPLDKVKEVSKYKFYLCYENIKDVYGYITEKIFECFYAKCIPIYWGASNVQELIPADCYINARQFKSVEEMYSYMKNMKEDEFNGYISRIESFLNSVALNKFSVDIFAQTLIGDTVNSKK